MNLKLKTMIAYCGTVVAMAALSVAGNAQHLTLEGQTGGFITPTAYVVPSANSHSFSLPAVGYHFIGASDVIGNINTISVTEGFGNRFEFGYTRSIHTKGNDANFSGLWDQTTPDFSKVQDYNGMNIIHGKAVVFKENTKKFYTPGFAIGGLYRQGDQFVSGAVASLMNAYETETLKTKTYGNGDIYGVVTKTWARKPVPLLINFGLKGTNSIIFGIGGVANSWYVRPFGGLGIPVPVGKNLVLVPSAGFAGESSDVKNLPNSVVPVLYPGTRMHIPTTLDYAVRFTQRTNPHFSVDLGIGQVAGNVGVGLNSSQSGYIPINLKARHVFGMGVSFRP